MNNIRISIIGLGLIGGSLAKTIRRKHENAMIKVCDPNEDILKKAKSEGVADEILSRIDHRLIESDYLFLCAPVSVNAALIEDLKKLYTPEDNCLISDCGSMKANICEAVNKNGMGKHFIGGHPMAGLEKGGYDNSDAYLFENVYYIISPEKDVDTAVKDRFRNFLTGLDMIPIELSPSDHDRALSYISHLPHIISASLVNLVSKNDKDSVLSLIAAGGFKDITRISSSSADMWTLVSMGNKEKILPALDEYIDELKNIRNFITSDNSSKIHDFFENAKEYRDDIPNKKTGALPISYMLLCDIIDEEGEIATIATRLSTHHINIKNIGIVHNRENEQGVLSIEFYDDNALNEASKLLKKYKYTVYER